MLNLVIYFILAYGICNMIIFANGPFHVFRKMHVYFKANHPMLDEMTTCMICFPTWVGFFLSAVNIVLFPQIAFTPMNMVIPDNILWPIIIMFDGLLTSGGCWLIHTFQELMERTNA